MEKYKLMFDGSCWPNPGGTAAYGFILFKNGHELERGNGEIGTGPEMSNNYAEHWAAFIGLLAFQKYFLPAWNYVAKPTRLMIQGDSQLVVNQLRGKWKLRKASLYYPAGLKAVGLLNAISKAKNIQVEINWIPRESNQDCDDLSKIRTA